jgi:hypothetical protein
LARRAEKCAPKRGQKEWDLFKSLYGSDFDKFDGIQYDQEEKITEFNYENFINRHLLKDMDTSSEEFKDMIKMMNLESRTEYEQHKEN